MAKLLDYCTLLGATLLVLVAITGPLYAFLIMSCVSTLPCNVRSLVASIGATCKEATPYDDGTELLHGQKCSLQCLNPALEPNTPELLCLDGRAYGEEWAACVPRKVFVPPEASGLVEGAVTGGELRDACVRAANLQCEAVPGGTAILLQLQNLTQPICSDLLEECKGYNTAFTFMSHVGYTEGAALGICSLGCYVPSVSRDQEGSATGYLPGPTTAAPFFVSPPSGSILEKCPGMPMCINVNTSCNEEDNGDYYRYPTCAAGLPQWVKLDQSRRIRYDNQPQYSQGGKWVIEGGVNPAVDTVGEVFARQPSFDLEPVFESTDWYYKCRQRIGPSQYSIQYRNVEVELASCSCDGWNDCNGHGKAIGSKTNGPYCTCKCDEGYEGANCEIKLCKAPGVLFAPVPPCYEGMFIRAGGVCTPVCNQYYVPSYDIFNCPEDALGLLPSDFECRRSETFGEMSESDEAEMFGAPKTTTPLPDCAPIDCSFRGVPAGPKERRADGSCICECRANFTGNDCNTEELQCSAPDHRTIRDAMRSTCLEGSSPTTICTPQCQPGYYPLPSVLECSYFGLEPPTFGCYGGPDPREVWCETMKNIAIGGSIVAVVSLMAFCICRAKAFERVTEAFVTRKQLVEVEKDVDGKYYVVRMEGKQENSSVPKRIRDRQLAVEAQNEKDQLQLQQGKYTSQSLLFVPDTLIAIEEHEEQMAYARGHPGGGGGQAIYTDGFNDMYVVRDQLDDMQANQFTDDVEAETTAVITVAATRQPGGETQSGMALRQSAAVDDVPGVVDVESGVKGGVQIDAQFGGSCSSACDPGNVPTAAEIVARTASGNPPTALELIASSTQQQLASRQSSAQTTEVSMSPEIMEFVRMCQPEDLAWSVKVLQLEERANEARRLAGIKRRNEANKASADAEARIKALLQETAEEREDIEVAIREGLKAGDAEALRSAAKRGRAVLARLAGTPPGPTAGLVRLLQIAESRVDQYDERVTTLKSIQEHEDRVARGDAPDWTITPEQLWRYIEECNVGKVRAGMKAKLPVQSKSKDGKRFTVMHVAARDACKDGAEETASDRLLVMEALLGARANPNATDALDRTPLDLALCEGVPDAASLPIVDEMRKRGLRTVAEAGEEARLAEEAAAKKAAGEPVPPASPLPTNAETDDPGPEDAKSQTSSQTAGASEESDNRSGSDSQDDDDDELSKSGDSGEDDASASDNDAVE